MFKKFGGALKRLGRKAKIAASLMSVAAVTAITTVIASAEETTSSSPGRALHKILCKNKTNQIKGRLAKQAKFGISS